MNRLPVVAALLGSMVAVPLAAQHSPPAFERWETRTSALGRPETSPRPQPSVVEVPRRDYRHEGLLIGSVAFGTLGAVVGRGLSPACTTEPGGECGPDRLGNAVALGLVGAAIGGGLGYLVGRLSTKPSPVLGDSTAP
jgi:uncharacterized membrane protein YeaQ/YmgE (transglycosylase-associated protein family)